MIAIIFRLTLRQLLGQKRTLFLAAVGLLPLLMAVIYRAGDWGEPPAEFVAGPLMNTLLLNGLLPLTALILATAAIGSEIEDGTIVYLLAKPLERWQILAGKLLAAWGATALLVLASATVGGVVALAGEGEWRVLIGFLVALITGSLAYSSLFVLLSVLTSRALLVGLGYAFIWEGVITNLAPGVQRFSIREYTASIAEAAADTDPWVFDAELGITFAAILTVVVTLVASALAAWRLSRFELGEAA